MIWANSCGLQQRLLQQLFKDEVKNFRFQLCGLKWKQLQFSKNNRENCGNKILVTNCVNCVLEMPKCNELQKKYRNRNDIVFLSLAFDPPKTLKNFLRKTKFEYARLSRTEGYVERTLVSIPSHQLWLLTRKGI